MQLRVTPQAAPCGALVEGVDLGRPLAAEQVEARLSACCAELVEIASTASRVRRELVAAPRDRMSADEAVRRLREEATLADRARREAGARAARVQELNRPSR